MNAFSNKLFCFVLECIFQVNLNLNNFLNLQITLNFIIETYRYAYYRLYFYLKKQNPSIREKNLTYYKIWMMNLTLKYNNNNKSTFVFLLLSLKWFYLFLLILYAMFINICASLYIWASKFNTLNDFVKVLNASDNNPI